MGRPPSQQVNAEISRLRRYLGENLGKNDEEIIQELGIKRRRFYYYKERIREEDKEAWKEMAKETFEERSKKIMDAIEFANKIDKEIAETPGDGRARVQAANQLIQNNVWAMQLLERGPKIMPKLETKVIQIEQSKDQESIRDQTV
jgi:hypothetical protein